MMTRRPRWELVLVAAAVCSFSVAGCTKCSKQPTGEQEAGAAAAPVGIPIKLRLDEAEQKAAQELAGKIKNERFSNEAVRDKNNAKLFLFLAATSDKPAVIIASLEALRMSFASPDAAKQKPFSDEDYGAVVAAHLGSANLKVQGYALEAAAHAVGGKDPHAPTVAALLKIATSHPNLPARAEAIDRLRLVRDFQQDPKIADAFLKALDSDQPYLVARSLFGLRLRATGLVMRNQFLDKARQLLKHTDPGVRGRAAELVGRLGAGNEEIARELEAMLQDPHPFTRSAACAALAHMGDLASVHALVALLGDTEKNIYEIRGFKLPTDREGLVRFDGSAWAEVRDAALRSLERLSMKTKVRFVADKVDAADVPGSLTKNAKAAKAWYAKVKAQLPQPRKADKAKG